MGPPLGHATQGHVRTPAPRREQTVAAMICLVPYHSLHRKRATVHAGGSQGDRLWGARCGRRCLVRRDGRLLLAGVVSEHLTGYCRRALAPSPSPVGWSRNPVGGRLLGLGVRRHVPPRSLWGAGSGSFARGSNAPMRNTKPGRRFTQLAPREPGAWRAMLGPVPRPGGARAAEAHFGHPVAPDWAHI